MIAFVSQARRLSKHKHDHDPRRRQAEVSFFVFQHFLTFSLSPLLAKMGEMSGHILHVDPESVGERQRSGADLLRDEQLRARVWHWKGIKPYCNIMWNWKAMTSTI